MEIPKPADFAPLQDGDAQAVREAVLLDLGRAGEAYLSDYSRRFGNILNADDAATLFAPYNADRARFRVAVHPAATWIRDESFERALAHQAPEGRNRVVFTAGGNAAGKSTAIEFSGSVRRAQVILDSTFSNPAHAAALVNRALVAGKRVTILHVDRPLEDALIGMLERGRAVGRLVTVNQLIRSREGAVDSVRQLWKAFERDPRFEFTFIRNSEESGTQESSFDSLVTREYTIYRELLDGILDAGFRAGTIDEATYRHVRGH